MKISTNRIEAIKQMVEDIDQIENLIQLHKKYDNDDFMTNQYVGKKQIRFQTLVKFLFHPSLNKDGFPTFPFLQKIMHKYYPNSLDTTNNEVFKALENATLNLNDIIVETTAQLDSPTLLLFPEIVKKNIAHAIEMIGDIDRFRPHIKTHKSAEATALLIAAGVTKFKCATIAEAEMLGICGAKDVLLAYQPVGPKLQRFISVIKHYPATQYSCLIDHIEAARAMALLFLENKLEVPVFLDLNVGQNRTGIAPGEAAFELYKACANMEGIRPIGIQAYDGHIRDIDFDKRTAHCNEAFKSVELFAETIINAGFNKPIIIAGGSPTFPIHAKRNEVECSPGTFIYWDKGYSDLCPEQPFSPAVLLMTRVISLPDETKICLDLGHKSVAAENEIHNRIYFPEHPELIPIGQSEEHLVLEAGKGHSFKPGAVLFGIPFHICPTVALYESAPIVENHKIIGEWHMIARNRKIDN